ncbi:MAG TPA: hypothetical protein VG708_04165 [Mycobacteriales bacterium]|nr:hypothetical protein [Mycobacteriales bacterium]
MDGWLVAAVVLAAALFVVTSYMEWVGILNVLSKRSATRYDECGHLRAWPTSRPYTKCWHCRHVRLEHLLHP